MSRKESIQRSVTKALAEGRCITCGKPRGADGTKCRCRPCAAKILVRQTVVANERIAKGLCRDCGLPPLKTKTRCAKCVEDHNARQKKVNDAKRESK